VVRQEIGELVVRSVWPGMTDGFWHDYARYLTSYWGRFPVTWHHVDLAYIDRDGYWYLLGRSDDTIKVAGKRLSPAEVEGEALGCFVVLQRDEGPVAACSRHVTLLTGRRRETPYRCHDP